jgi:hypothetical protein
MTTTYKVLDAEGPKLTVKYSDGTRSMTLERMWDGKVPIDEFLGGFDPLPPVATGPAADTSGLVGKTGTAQMPVPLAAPPITPPPAASAPNPAPTVPPAADAPPPTAPATSP